MVIQCQRILSQESPGSSQSPPGKLFHETLTPEERLILLGHHSAVPHYEMFSAGEELSRALEVVEGRRRVKRSSSRRKRSTAGGGDDHHLNESTAEATFKEDGSSSSPILRLQFTAFSSPFHLRLWPNHKLLSPAFQMINEINGGRQSPFKTKSPKEVKVLLRR
ncbi:hypothetical protein TYRP_010289 [Tyrophagus putrescentiae]|nr:hypothetical protein TYRP_010289 [Tyrophagus putrescentiae]